MAILGYSVSLHIIGLVEMIVLSTVNLLRKRLLIH